MKGWFDLWRENGGPTLYSHSNRTAVSGDVTTVTVCIVFGTLYAAFFIVFPGMRNEVRTRPRGYRCYLEYYRQVRSRS